MGHGMLLYSGKLVDPLYLKEDDIKIQDIAHALSLICRYNGHTSKFYSVAEHSFHVSRIAYENSKHQTSFERKAVGLWGLLHDAPEAYIGDLIRPLKKRPEFQFFQDIEERLMSKIADRFGISTVFQSMPSEVHYADGLIVGTEMRQLCSLDGHESDPNFTMPGGFETLPESRPITLGMSPELAESTFLRTFYDLSR